MNDPLGLTFHGGRYHLFYQHVPGADDWAPQCRWGHATSSDLLTWATGSRSQRDDMPNHSMTQEDLGEPCQVHLSGRGTLTSCIPLHLAHRLDQ
ncbi:hypothetical protein CTI14_50175 [Methylobacterium radiotolerans]|nr:hypothetical protein CTI14_50175 [Methylobacterium radiotolerans]